MEEKERYKVYKDNRGNAYICDTSKNVDYKTYQEFVDLLNQQDKRIKKLEDENGYVLFEDGYDENGNEIHKQVYTTYKEEFEKLVLDNKKLRKENQQLKQQLHDLPKKIEEEIKKELYDCGRTYLEDEPYIEICIVKGILDTILKKFGGENE